MRDATLNLGAYELHCRLCIVAARDDDVRMHARWGDVLLVHRADRRKILIADRNDVATAFLGITQDAPEEAYIVVGVDEDA